MPETTPIDAVRTLCEGLFDYAGLFPPAKLDMAPAVENYAAARDSEHAWMLARLVVPAARLDEFERVAGDRLPTTAGAEPWRITALLPPAGEEALDEGAQRIADFNDAHANPESGLAVVDACELKGSDGDAIEAAMDAIPESVRVFVELPHEPDPRGLIAAVAGAEASAKIRCGGVTPDLIPTAAQVARFVRACAVARVPFKATAGLHHPVRAEHPLTYEPDAPRATMHGFLNVLLATALAMDEATTVEQVESVLTETEPGAFLFNDAGAGWRGRTIPTQRLARLREHQFISIGSCSFDEPRDDLRELGLL